MPSLVLQAEPRTVEVWDQRNDESELEHQLFKRWLALRPRPHPNDFALAVRLNWVDRATAYDANEHLQGLSPQQIRNQIFSNWVRTTFNESRKWLDKSMRSEEPSLEPQRIADFIELITDPARVQATKPTHDPTRLSPQRLELFITLLEEMEIK